MAGARNDVVAWLPDDPKIAQEIQRVPCVLNKGTETPQKRE